MRPLSKWRDVLKEIPQGSILYLILFIKQLKKNRIETKLVTFEEEMKRAARSVLAQLEYRGIFFKVEIFWF